MDICLRGVGEGQEALDIVDNKDECVLLSAILWTFRTRDACDWLLSADRFDGAHVTNHCGQCQDALFQTYLYSPDLFAVKSITKITKTIPTKVNSHS